MDGFNTDHLLNYGRRHCWGIGCASSFSLHLQGRLLQALKEAVEGREGGRVNFWRVLADPETLSEEEELGGVHLLQSHGPPRHAVPPL